MEKELTTIEPKQVTIFGSGTAKDQIEKAEEISKAVSSIIEKKKLYSIINGKKYVQCEGWTTMGAMLGLFPQIVKVDEDGQRYIATCEVRTATGNLISRAEAECSTEEGNKKGQDRYATRSMAQTRAVSKAFRICLSWVMVLGNNYQTTPAEEVPKDGFNNAKPVNQPQADKFYNDTDKNLRFNFSPKHKDKKVEDVPSSYFEYLINSEDPPTGIEIAVYTAMSRKIKALNFDIVYITESIKNIYKKDSLKELSMKEQIKFYKDLKDEKKDEDIPKEVDSDNNQ
jgi:hypothetical protein